MPRLPKRSDRPLARPSFLAQLGLLHQPGHPRPVPALEHHALGQPLDGGRGIGNVDGIPAAGHGGIGDVQVAVGLRQYRVQPQTITGYMRVIAHQACHQQDRRRRGPRLRRTRRRVLHGLAEPFRSKPQTARPVRVLGGLQQGRGIRCASSAKPYRTRPAAIMSLSCGQTEPLW